ncbi:MAG: hypothetical protein AAGK03_03525 [Pseudomonadota bacterium]
MIGRFTGPRDLVSALNKDIIIGAAMRRTGGLAGLGAGDGLAADPCALVEIAARKGCEDDPETEAGKRTGLRRVPPVLAAFPIHDGRRLAIGAYATAIELLDAGPAISLLSIPGGSGKGVPDGGATNRIRNVAVIRAACGAANRWKWSRALNDYVEAAPRVLLESQRGSARSITAQDLLDAVAIDGIDLAELLRRHGWSVHSKHTKFLREAFNEMTFDLADALGFGNRVRRA